jgi:hypothetical protein
LTDKGDDEEDKFDAMGNKIEGNKKAKKLTSSELRKKKKDVSIPPVSKLTMEILTMLTANGSTQAW